MIFHSKLRQPSDYFPITHSALAPQRFGKTMRSRRSPRKSARLLAQIWHNHPIRAAPQARQNGGNV